MYETCITCILHMCMNYLCDTPKSTTHVTLYMYHTYREMCLMNTFFLFHPPLIQPLKHFPLQLPKLSTWILPHQKKKNLFYLFLQHSIFSVFMIISCLNNSYSAIWKERKKRRYVGMSKDNWACIGSLCIMCIVLRVFKRFTVYLN